MAHLTEAAIQDAFLKLLSEQPFDKITVTQLVEECQITRRTFYYHYSDLYELLDTILRRETERALDEFEATGSWEECMITASRFAREHKRAVYHIYNSIDRNAYEDFLMRMCAHTARLVVGEMTPDGKIAPEDRDALIYFAKCQFFGLCMDWTKSGMNDNIVEKYRRAVRLLTDMSHGE